MITKREMAIFFLILTGTFGAIIAIAAACSNNEPMRSPKPAARWETRIEESQDGYRMLMIRHLKTGRCYISPFIGDRVLIETAPEVCAPEAEKP